MLRRKVAFGHQHPYFAGYSCAIPLFARHLLKHPNRDTLAMKVRMCQNVRIVRDMESKALLPNRLRAARAYAGYKVSTLAKETGIPKHRLYRYERGEYVPDALELAAIAKATGREMAYFFEEAAA